MLLVLNNRALAFMACPVLFCVVYMWNSVLDIEANDTNK